MTEIVVQMAKDALITELREHQRDYPSLIHAELCGRAANEIERLHAILPSKVVEVGRDDLIERLRSSADACEYTVRSKLLHEAADALVSRATLEHARGFAAGIEAAVKVCIDYAFEDAGHANTAVHNNVCDAIRGRIRALLPPISAPVDRATEQFSAILHILQNALCHNPLKCRECECSAPALTANITAALRAFLPPIPEWIPSVLRELQADRNEAAELAAKNFKRAMEAEARLAAMRVALEEIAARTPELDTMPLVKAFYELREVTKTANAALNPEHGLDPGEPRRFDDGNQGSPVKVGAPSPKKE